MGRIFVTLILIVAGFLIGAFLVNIPNLHLEQGLPLLPAILSAEASLMAVALCGYGLYRTWFPGQRGPRRPDPFTSDGRPWLANPSWAKGRVTHSTRSIALFLWFFAVHWWAAIGFMVAERKDAILEEGGPVLFLAGALILIGVITILAAIKKTAQWLSYGRSTLIIQTLPGRPGSAFESIIETKFKTKPKKAFLIHLTGFERHWTTVDHAGTDDVRRRHSVQDQMPFFEESIRVPPSKMALADGCVHVPFQFDMPGDVPDSGYVDDDVEVIWKIDVRKTGRDDPDYEAEFEIPVFAVH